MGDDREDREPGGPDDSDGAGDSDGARDRDGPSRTGEGDDGRVDGAEDPPDRPAPTDASDLPADPGGPADSPDDVDASVRRLLAEARDAVREGRVDAALDVVDAADRLARTRVGDPDRAAVLRHGCARVADLAEADPGVAAEYLDAMDRRLD